MTAHQTRGEFAVSFIEVTMEDELVKVDHANRRNGLPHCRFWAGDFSFGKSTRTRRGLSLGEAVEKMRRNRVNTAIESDRAFAKAPDQPIKIKVGSADIIAVKRVRPGSGRCRRYLSG